MGSAVTAVALLDYSQRVLREMGPSLDRIRQLTNDFVDHSEEQRLLVELQETVQSANDTFSLIECYGAELLTAELLALLQAIEIGSVDEATDHAPVLILAGEKLSEYIEYLKAGGQDLPLALLSLVNNMRACRGVGLLSEALIVSPHFQIPDDPDATIADAEAEDAYLKVIRRTRVPLMRDLVTWYKEPVKANMLPLITAFANLQIASPTSAARHLWAAARAVSASLASDSLEDSAAVKMLLGQLERYLQRLDQAGEKGSKKDSSNNTAALDTEDVGDSTLELGILDRVEFPDNLFKNLLYYVALSTSTETSVADIKKKFRLSELLPPRSSLEQARDALGGPGARLSDAICNSLGKEISEVKSLLDSVAVQQVPNTSMIDDAVTRLRQVSYTLLLLGLNQARQLNDRAVAQLLQCREAGNFAELQNIASDIIQVDAALEAYLHGDGRPAVFADDFKAKPNTSGKLSPYQYNLIVEQCLAEAVRSLQTVQSDYLLAMEDKSRKSALSKQANELDSIADALQILPLPELKPLLNGAGDYLRKLAQRQSMQSDEEQKSFAELMVCSELYLDSALQRQPAAADLLTHADEALSSVLTSSSEIKKFNGSKKPTPVKAKANGADRDMMAVFIDEALSSFGAINQALADWDGDNTRASLERIRQQFHTLKGSGMVAGATTLSAFAAANEDMLEHHLAQGSTIDSEKVRSLLNESSAVMPQLINQLSDSVTEGQHQVDGLDTLLDRIGAQASAGNVSTAEFSNTGAVEMFDQTVTTNQSVDEFSETLDVANSERLQDMTSTSTISMHDLGAVGDSATQSDDYDYTRTVALDPADGQVASVFGASTTTDEHEFTRTIKISEQNAILDPDDEFSQTLSLDNEAQHARTVARSHDNPIDSDVDGNAAGSNATDKAELDPLSYEALSAEATLVIDSSDSEHASTYSLDNTLLRVFYTECLSHIALLKEIMNPVLSDPGELPSVEMQRSLHTLHGSAQTADVPGVAKLVGTMEEIVNTRLSAGKQFTHEESRLYKSTINALEQQVDALQEGRPIPEQVARIEHELTNYLRKIKSEQKTSSASLDLQELYIEEATELLTSIHGSVNELGKVRDQQDPVQRLQADLHTLKGGARVAQFNAIADITHALEGAIMRWAEELPLKSNQLHKLQEVVDAITVNLEQAKSGGSLGQFDWLIRELSADEKGSAVAERRTADDLFELSQLLPTPYTQQEYLEQNRSDAATTLSAEAATETVDGTDKIIATRKSSTGAELVKLDAAAIGRLSQLATEVSIHQARVGDYFNDLRDSLIDLDKTTDRLRYKLRDLQKDTDLTLSFLENTLDVDGIGDATAQLDPSDLEQFTRRREDSRQLSEILADFDAIRSRLHERMRTSQESLSLTARIGSDIQQSLMRSQLIRFSQHAQRLSSTIRQTATALDKDVVFELVGGDCAIDRSLHKELLVPVEHLLRNAIAHGIETKEQRKQSAKSESGEVQVRVKFDGNDLVVAVSDDGVGVDYDAVREKLGSDMDDQAVLDALFKTGLSTVDKPNQYAGRGVGLDVVERSLSRLNGSVSIESKKNEGTTVTLRIPQRVVIHQVVLVEIDGLAFGIPVNNVHSVVAAQSEESLSFNGLEYPSRRLSDLLDYPALSPNKVNQLTSQAILIEAGGQRVALRVNEVPGYRELISRPLGRQVSSMGLYTGGSILSNGQSVLILDLNRVLTQAAKQRAAPPPKSEKQKLRSGDILVVDDSVTMRTYADRILRAQGYSAEFARDGIEALERMRDFKPDFVLLDIEMPRMDGFELLEKMRVHPDLQSIPVVMVSSRSSMQHRRRASDLGVKSYIVKPYREEELIRLLQRMTPQSEQA